MVPKITYEKYSLIRSVVKKYKASKEIMPDLEVLIIYCQQSSQATYAN